MKRFVLPLVLSACAALAQSQTNVPVSSEARLQATAITGYLNVRTFGALGIGTDDETAAVQAALTEACTKGTTNPNGGTEVYFPAGIYPVHGLQITCTNVLVRGAGPNSTYIQYNGPQNTGTYPVTPSSSAYILAFTKGGSWGGLRDLEMNGCTSLQPVTGIATDLVLIEGPVDAEMSFSNLALGNTIHDGIHLIELAAAFNPETMGGTRGYVTAQRVATTGGTGTGMTVNITASDGRITGVAVNSQGSGYLPGDTVVIAQQGSSDDARFIVGASTVYFNWFLHQIRFDGTGGYGIHIEGLLPADGFPFAMDDFTWTTGIAKSAWLQKNGYLESYNRLITPWGKGVIGVLGGRGYQFSLANARVEGGYPQSPVGPGQEANLFADEMPVQPSIALNLSGGGVASVTIKYGGFGWNSGNIRTVYSGCSKSPSVDWIVSHSVVVGAKIASGGSCARGATAQLFLSSVGKLFVAHNITGFISNRYKVPLIYSASGTDSYRLENVQISGSMGNYMNGRTGAISILGFGTADDQFSGALQSYGWSTQGHSFFSIPENQLPYSYQSVSAGDIIFHDAGDYRSKAWGQIGAYRVITYPVYGSTMLRPERDLCSGKLTPSGDTWSGCTPSQLRASQVSVNSALTFPTGGPSLSGLDTYVTAVNWSTGVITTAAAGSGASTVDFTTPQWRDSWSTETSYPTSTATIYYQGEVVYNSAPAAGRPIWWSCTTKTCTGGSGWIAGPAYGSGLGNTAHTKGDQADPPAPAWLEYLGTSADGANTNARGSLSGEKYYTAFTVPAGNVVTVSNGLVIHATGACTLNGAILANGAVNAWAGSGVGGASSGGSGGGAGAGASGKSSYYTVAQMGDALNPGVAGSAGGGSGGHGLSMSISSQRALAASGMGLDGLNMNGARGIQGADSGGSGGGPGASVVLICGSISGSGAIDVSGGPGNPPDADRQGAGSGGGGGVVILSSRAPVASWPVIHTGGGAGGQVTVPYAVPSGTSVVASGDSCAVQPKIAFGVRDGTLSSCAVLAAGEGCGSAPRIHWAILGGGSGGTITPVWSGGRLASCTVAGGSGYMARTYKSAGIGGDGGNGWYAEFQGW